MKDSGKNGVLYELFYDMKRRSTNMTGRQIRIAWLVMVNRQRRAFENGTDLLLVPPIKSFDATHIELKYGGIKPERPKSNIMENPIIKMHDDALITNYKIAGQIAEKHDFDCQCYDCEFFLKLGDEIRKRGLQEKAK